MSDHIRTARAIFVVLATIVLAFLQFGVLTAGAASSTFTVDC